MMTTQLHMTYAGLSSGAKAALFYAAQIRNVPAIYMAEPDEIAVLSGKTHVPPAASRQSHVQVRQVVELSM